MNSSDHLATEVQNNCIDQIFEIIPEMSESNDMYCIPQVSKHRKITKPLSPLKESRIKLKSQEKQSETVDQQPQS